MFALVIASYLDVATDMEAKKRLPIGRLRAAVSSKQASPGLLELLV